MSKVGQLCESTLVNINTGEEFYYKCKIELIPGDEDLIFITGLTDSFNIYYKTKYKDIDVIPMDIKWFAENFKPIEK